MRENTFMNDRENDQQPKVEFVNKRGDIMILELQNDKLIMYVTEQSNAGLTNTIAFEFDDNEDIWQLHCELILAYRRAMKLPWPGKQLLDR